MSPPPTLTEIERRLVARVVGSEHGEALLDEACEGLAALGLPIWRATIAVPTIDPIFRGVRLEWRRDRNTVIETTAHGPEGEAVWARSPISWLIERGLREGRWRLGPGETTPDLPHFSELAAEGATEYALFLTELAPDTVMRGVAVSFATDRVGGFSDAELATLGSLVPALALATAKLCYQHGLREVVATYLGPKTARQVLDGRIRRGQGEVMPAAILLADLRGFTSLADRESPLSVVGWLDEHFDALGEPVARHGGEILKFLGDGFLAVFPVEDAAAHPCAACAGALAAAREALVRNDALNLARRAGGLPELRAGLALHYGDVVYGNVGTGRRLDFTVIGRAVNETSRMEKVCEELGEPLLMSDAFVQRCAEMSARCLGEFALRGIERPQRLWTWTEPTAA